MPIYALLGASTPSQVGDVLTSVAVVNAVRTPGSQQHQEDRVGGGWKGVLAVVFVGVAFTLN